MTPLIAVQIVSTIEVLVLWRARFYPCTFLGVLVMAVGLMAGVSEGTIASFFTVVVSMGRKAINGTREPEVFLGLILIIYGLNI